MSSPLPVHWNHQGNVCVKDPSSGPQADQLNQSLEMEFSDGYFLKLPGEKVSVRGPCLLQPLESLPQILLAGATWWPI